MNRRRALSVALIGPDGAGKTSVARRLSGVLDVPVHYLYMGVNADASGVLLPTTRLVRAWRRARGGGGRVRRIDRRSAYGSPPKAGSRRRIRSAVRTVNLIAEEWYRQLVARRYARRGGVVVFDRHFVPDYYAHDIAPSAGSRPLERRIHGFFLRRYPRPDLAILLDAPADVLHARRPENSIEFLGRRKTDYAHLSRFAARTRTVDASQPLEQVTDAVATAIREALGSRVAEAA